MKKNFFWIGITIFTLIVGCNSTPVKETPILKGNLDQTSYTSPGEWFTVNLDDSLNIKTITDKVNDSYSMEVDFHDQDENHVHIHAAFDKTLELPYLSLKQAIRDGSSYKKIISDINGLDYIYAGTTVRKHPNLNLYFGWTTLNLFYRGVNYRITLETRTYPGDSNIEEQTEFTIDNLINHITYLGE